MYYYFFGFLGLEDSLWVGYIMLKNLFCALAPPHSWLYPECAALPRKTISFNIFPL